VGRVEGQHADADALREVLDWYCDLLEVSSSEELYGFLIAEYEEELAILASIPRFSMRRIGADCLRTLGDHFTPVDWVEAARHDRSLAAVLAYVNDQYAFLDDLPLPPPGSVTFWTLGWSKAFHSTPRCNALLEGQRFVLWRGGEPAEVVSGSVEDAVFHAKKRPCKVCWGGRLSTWE
jgi:hypothetical protein